MAQSILWLRCQASRGQFGNELAVCGVEYNGEEFSLFVDRQFVECEEGLGNASVEARLQVVELAREGNLVLIRLPGRTLTNGQSVTVTADSLDAQAFQKT